MAWFLASHTCAVKSLLNNGAFLLNKDITVQVSDTTEDESSNTGGQKKMPLLLKEMRK